ncbi:hypothetical protein PFISCL1PPCAC_4118, partial [Pristionchus fissidentatus]
ESLSSISVSSDDCMAIQYTAKRIITIWVQPAVVLLAIQPAIEAPAVIHDGVTRLEEREVQTVDDGREWR